MSEIRCDDCEEKIENECDFCYEPIEDVEDMICADGEFHFCSEECHKKYLESLD